VVVVVVVVVVMKTTTPAVYNYRYIMITNWAIL